MTNAKLNIAKALETAKEVLKKMAVNSMDDPKLMLQFSNRLSDEYKLTQSQSIMVIDEALKIA